MTESNQPQITHPKYDKFFQLDSEMRARFETALAMPGSPWRVDLLDSTGMLFGLNTIAVTELISHQLSEPNSSVRLLTFEAGHIETTAPRFQMLRKRFGHNLFWRIIPAQHHGKIQESSALFKGGASLLLRKPVRTAFHGYQSHDISDMKAYLNFYDLAWDSSEEAPPTRTLGI